MENMNSSPAESIIASNLTIDQLLRAPFEPVTLFRPMKLFKGALGLTINQKASPSPEILVKLITPYTSHQAMLRDQAGDQFKNFTHYIRGQHEVSQTTLSLLCQNFGIPVETLKRLRHGKEDGPLLPQILELFYCIEGFYRKVYEALTAGEIICKNCHSNMMNDSDAWWNSQSIAIEPPEYQFLERILAVIVGGTFINNFIRSFTNDSKVIKASDLCIMNHRPIGNWLALVMHAYNCTNLKELAVQLQMKGVDSSHELLKKWSSEQILIPMADANKMIDGLPNKVELFTMLLISRSLAFCIDFLISSVNGTSYLEISTAQKLVLERVQGLEEKILIMWNFRRNHAKKS